MATLTIGGRKITVDDKFLSLPPDQQQKTVDEIEASLGAAPAAPLAAPASPATAPTPVAAAGESFAPGDTGPFVGPALPPEFRPATELSMDELAGVLSGAPSGFGGMAPGRAAKLGGQAVGAAGAELGAMALDIPVLGAHALGYGVEKVARPINNFFRQPTMEVGSAPMPSDLVKQGASWIGKKLGYEEVTPQTPEEQAFSNILRMGTQAFGGAGALTRYGATRVGSQFPRFADDFVKSYAATPIRSMAADTAGGATAGAALTGAQQLPESVRETGGGTVGTMADLTAMLAGGVSGATLMNAATKTPSTVVNAFQRSRPAVDITLDPVTGGAVANSTADEAARFLQSHTSGNPRDVAAELAARVGQMRQEGMPVPTTGLILPEESGLAGIDKRQRTVTGPSNTQLDPNLPADVRQQYNPIERDKAQRAYASEQVQSTRDPNADPALFQERAQTRADLQTAARQRELERAAEDARIVQQAREEATQPVLAQELPAAEASRRIHNVWGDTRATESERSAAIYSRPEWTEAEIPTGPLQRAAEEIRTGATGTTPVRPGTEEFLQRVEAIPDTGVLSGQELSTLKKDIENGITRSLRDAQNFQQIKDLKNAIDQSISRLPQGHPARETIELAAANWQERIEPYFRRFASERIDLKTKTDPGQVYPSETGKEFARTGEDAQQIMGLAALRGNTEQVAADMRTVIFDQLARKGVIRDGVFDPNLLQRWRNQNHDITQHIPGLQDEIDNMTAAARQGSNTAGVYADDIRAAEQRVAQTQKNIERSPVGTIADKTPQEAVKSIMEGSNAVQKITELRSRMGNGPDAVRSLKANVADYFADRVKQIDPTMEIKEHGVRLQALIKDFNKHRETLVAAGYTPEEMQALQRAQTALLPLMRKNVQATVGSTTAESREAVMRPLELGLKTYYGTLKGGSVFRNIKIALRLAKGDTSSAVEQLVTRAMFDPDLAGVLLTRDVAKAGTPAWNAQLQKVLRRTEAAKGLAKPEDQGDPDDVEP
jgi:hypothetical protein